MDQVSLLIPPATENIINERMQYKDVYYLIEKYISEVARLEKKKRLIVGGSMGINLLLEKERSLEDYVYELYTEDPLINANSITNKIDVWINDKLKDKTKIVFLSTKIPYQRYEIFLDGRLIVLVLALPTGGYDIVQPLSTKSFNQEFQLLILSPEIYLIDIYRTLYSPNAVDNWETAISDENKLFQHLKKRIKGKGVDPVDGGADEELSHEMRQKIELALMKFVTNNRQTVLIGEHAMHLLIKSELKTKIVQILSVDPDTDVLEIKKVIFSVLGKNVPITTTTKELHIMQDYRIRRMSVRIMKKEVMYIYNSPQYDLIPFNTAMNGDSFIQVGNPFVVLRFLLIDYWMIRWLSAGGHIDERFMRGRLDSVVAKLLELRTKISELDEKMHTTTIGSKFISGQATLLSLFPTESNDYVGIYEDESLAMKLYMKEQRSKKKYYHDYYPQESILRTKSRREIGPIKHD